MRKTALLLLAALPALAGEYAVLQSGFRLHAQRHETDGSVIRVYTETGTTEFPCAEIVRFEQEEYVAPAPKTERAKTADVAPARKTPEELVQDAAIKHGLRPEFVRSIASAESGMRQDAVSNKGALGIMQLMPGTAAELGANPKDAAQNTDAGARYLRQLLEKYKDKPDAVRLAIAAYNAGPGAVDRHGRVPPYRETQAYVDRVVRKYLKELEQQKTAAKRQAD